MPSRERSGHSIVRVMEQYIIGQLHNADIVSTHRKPIWLPCVSFVHCKVVKYSDFKFCSDVRADRLVGEWTSLIEHMDPVCIPYALQGDPEDHLGAILGGSRCCPPLVVESMAYFFKGNFVQRDLVVIPNVH